MFPNNQQTLSAFLSGISQLARRPCHYHGKKRLHGGISNLTDRADILHTLSPVRHAQKSYRPHELVSSLVSCELREQRLSRRQIPAEVVKTGWWGCAYLKARSVYEREIQQFPFCKTRHSFMAPQITPCHVASECKIQYLHVSQQHAHGRTHTNTIYLFQCTHTKSGQIFKCMFGIFTTTIG